ncbi:RES domain-containing protein [Angustibacter sp. Root456]|uniref:RES domain-containing protein n=1 Tax=Angustibacter sp. Root456 TaxID=1736539 RepID=UPI00138F4999|nr:RES domain-containing protein [Angustibacter sp. Root456]
MSARDVSAQLPPPDDLRGFPVRRLAPDAPVFRAHQARRSPWWFSSSGGRFDLSEPRGTCYVASSALVAVRERLGPVLAARSTLPAGALDGVVVSRLTLARPPTAAQEHRGERALRLANVRTAAAADFGVTRELESMTPYDVPVRWAAAFDAAGFDGVWYGPRFSPGAAGAVAAFGPAGQDDARAVDPEPVPVTQVAGVPAVVEPPRRRDLLVIEPPRGRVSRSR